MSRGVLICYCCHKEGHFAVNCPEKSTREKGSSHLSDEDVPDRKCPCGAGNCIVLTSGTPKNPGRKFYKCPLPKSSGTKCNFFEWCDSSISDPKHEVPQADAPECRCGAGKCRRSVVKKEGENKGREFYTCPVIKGTKCNFFEWCDTPISKQGRAVPLRSYPECSCGAGRCSRFPVKKDGKNKGRKFFVCPVKKGQGACNFFLWEDEYMDKGEDEEEDMFEAVNDGNDDGQPGERKPVTSFWATLIDQEKVRQTNSFHMKDEDDSEYDEASSDEKQSEAPSSIGFDVKEMVDVDDGALPAAMSNLKLSEDKRAHTPAHTPTKPGKCFRCGEEGHWAKDCVSKRGNFGI